MCGPRQCVLRLYGTKEAKEFLQSRFPLQIMYIAHCSSWQCLCSERQTWRAQIMAIL